MALPTVLDRICARRRADVAELKRRCDEAELRRLVAASARPVNSLQAACRAKVAAGRRAIVAEIKRASPSAGPFPVDVDVPAQAAAYVGGGATAISILTEPHEFLGRDEDLQAVRRDHPATPLLRKDFNVDPYQLWEARLLGADVVLLLVNVLGDRLGEFVEVAAEVGVEALVEVHDAEEMQRALATPAPLIGINARNLKTFETRLEWVEELLDAVPPDRVAIAESGVKTLADIERLERRGAGAFLIGETLMRSADPRALLQDWRA